MFDWLKKKKQNNETKQEDLTPMARTLEEVMKDIEDLPEESRAELRKRYGEKNSQDLADRIDEKVGDEERKEGDKDSQSARERVDEAVGASLADAKRGDSSELLERLEEHDKRFDALKAEIEEIRRGGREPKKAEKEEESKLDKLSRVYD